jgi:DNA replication ATP-dependent helicase Dna2
VLAYPPVAASASSDPPWGQVILGSGPATDLRARPPVAASASSDLPWGQVILGSGPATDLRAQKSHAVLAALTSPCADHNVMLTDTYRMNRWLTAWPSRTHYGGKLMAVGANSQRRLVLSHTPERFKAVFDPEASGIFIPTTNAAARTQNLADAALVVALCAAAVEGGLPLAHIGIVTPYRAQGRAVRNGLGQQFGRANARLVIADTVERMQGQERELIILSLATGDELFLSAVASFFFQPQRLNVAITRAVSKLIVIGPELGLAALNLEDPRLREWVAQYRDFVSQLKRVCL